MTKFTFGSLFAGIGGLDLGLERAGMVCKWQVEIEPFCQKVLAKHWPDVRRYEDVKECGKHNLETVDLICGGFPCQPHSVAGKRRGAEDDRNLWPEYLRIVTELRPNWVLGENVPGIISNAYIDTVLSDLEGAGYACTAVGVPAIALNAPHRRQRIWIVAHSSEERAWNIAGEIGANSRGKSRRDEQALRQDNREDGTNRTYSTSCTAADMAHSGSARCNTEDWGGFVCHTNGDCESKVRQEQQQSRTECDGETAANILSEGKWDVESDMGRTSNGVSRRLDGDLTNWWADGWEDGVPRVADGIANRVARLKSLGNAVVPQVAEWIGRRIMDKRESNI